ncbi:hypothetical protein BLOT_003002 [Blomia tropicalis]|nr:hypothetical protein BLOT_003002 [Blomia tropicalis]
MTKCLFTVDGAQANTSRRRMNILMRHAKPDIDVDLECKLTLLPIENGWKDSGTLDLYIQEFNLPIPMRTLWAKQINIRMGKQSDLGAQAMRPDGMNASSCRCVVADQIFTNFPLVARSQVSVENIRQVVCQPGQRRQTQFGRPHTGNLIGPMH